LKRKNQPIIVITAEVGVAIQKEMDSAGRYLQKPFKIEIVLHSLIFLLP
jgi:DNA-binding response OmpR family regulator